MPDPNGKPDWKKAHEQAKQVLQGQGPLRPAQEPRRPDVRLARVRSTEHGENGERRTEVVEVPNDDPRSVHRDRERQRQAVGMIEHGQRAGEADQVVSQQLGQLEAIGLEPDEITDVLQLAARRGDGLEEAFTSWLTQNGLEIDEKTGELFSPAEEEITEEVDRLQAAYALDDDEVDGILRYAVENHMDVNTAFEHYAGEEQGDGQGDDGYYDDEDDDEEPEQLTEQEWAAYLAEQGIGPQTDGGDFDHETAGEYDDGGDDGGPDE